MRHTIFSIIMLALCLSATHVEAKKRTMKNPQYVWRNPISNINVNKVVLTDTATVLYVDVRGTYHEHIHYVGKHAFLEDERGERFPLRFVEGYRDNLIGQFAARHAPHTRMVFEPMPFDTNVFDLHVNDCYNPVHYYGIHDNKLLLDVPEMMEDSICSEHEPSRNASGAALLRGRFGCCAEYAQPIISIYPYYNTDLHHKTLERSGRMAMLKREDGTFEREVELSQPTLAYLQIEYKMKLADEKYGHRTYVEELVWLVPGDTTEIAINNSFGECNNISYSSQPYAANFLRNVPRAVYKDLMIQSSSHEQKQVSSEFIDSVEGTLPALRNYIAWKYKMNDDDKRLMGEFSRILTDACHAKPTISSAPADKTRCPHGLEGYDVLQRISGHLRGKYVFINFFSSLDDLKEVENLIEDFKDSKDFAFVFVACDSLFPSMQDYSRLRNYKLKNSDECYLLTRDEYNKLQYLRAECMSFTGDKGGMTLNREGDVVWMHWPLGNEYVMRRSMKDLLRAEKKSHNNSHQEQAQAMIGKVE